MNMWVGIATCLTVAVVVVLLFSGRLDGVFYALRCRLIRWLAGRDSFIVNVSITGTVDIPAASRGLYFDGGYIHGETRRGEPGTKASLTGDTP